MPATTRLYTSVIPPNPEKWRLKESWATDMSPTASWLWSAAGAVGTGRVLGAGRVYPGCGIPGGAGRAIPGYYPALVPALVPGSHIEHI